MYILYRDSRCYFFVIPKYLSHLSLASQKGTKANSVDLDQTPQNSASDQSTLH